MSHAKPSLPGPILGRIYEEALPHLATRHNELHTDVALGFALRLLEEEGGDPEVALAGTILHDVGWIKVPEELQLTAFGPNVSNPGLRDVHEAQGAIMAREILERVGFPPEKIDSVALIVSRHDSGESSDSIEEAIVKDADKLWRFSREGMEVDPARFGVGRGAHLEMISGKAGRWMLTPTGLRLAREEIAARRAEFD